MSMLSLFKKATATPFGQKRQKCTSVLDKAAALWYYSINFISLSKTVKRSSIRSAAEHRERPTLGTPRPHAGEVASESRTQRNTRPAAPHRSGSPAALPSRLRRALPTLQGTGNRRAAGAVLDLYKLFQICIRRPYNTIYSFVVQISRPMKYPVVSFNAHLSA